MANVAINVEVRSNGEVVLGKLGHQFEEVDRKAKSFSSNLSRYFAAGAMLAAGRALLNAVEQTAQWAEELDKVSQATGLGIRAVQQYETTAKNLGMSIDDVSRAMGRMQRGIAEGSKELTKLGLSISALQGMAPEGQFQAVAQAIMNISDPTQRAAAAIEIFGKSGADLIPVLADIASGAYKMNAALGDEQVKALKKADDAFDKLSEGWRQFKNEFVAGIVEMAAKTNDWKLGLFGISSRAPFKPGSWEDIARRESAATYLDQGDLFGSLTPPAGYKKEDPEKINREREKALKIAREHLAEQLKLNYALDGMAFRLEVATRELEQHLSTVVPTFTKASQIIGQADIDALNAFLGPGAEMGFTMVGTQVDAVKTKTVEWYDVLTSVAAQFGDLARIDGPIGAIAGMIGNIITGVAGIGAGLNTLKTAGSGFTGLLSKISGIGGIVGGAIGIGSAIFGGIRSLFGGKSAQEKEAERQKKLAAEEARKQAEAEAARKRAAGLTTAQGGITALIENLTYQDAAGKIVATFSDPKVAEAAAGLFGGTFFETFRKEGISGIEKLRPAWEKLHEQLIKMGLDPVKLGLGRVGQLLDVTKDPRTKALLGVSQGAGQLLRGAMDAGYVDLGFVKDSTTIARQTLQELQMQGLDSTTAAQAMADQLAALAQAYALTGQEMPEDLKAAMEAAGISVLPTQLEVLKESRDYLRQIAGATGHAEGAIVTRPHLAWVGEKGPEAIIPLRGRAGVSSGVNVTIQRALGVTRETEYAFDRRVERTMRRLLRQNSAVRYDARVAVNGGR